MDAFSYLNDSKKIGRKPVFVIYGSDAYQRHEALVAVRRVCVGDGDESLAVTEWNGDQAELARVLDELATLPFLTECRVVVVDEADGFVSQHRGKLEQYVNKPAASGVLVLVVGKWPSNTRLYKAVAKVGTAISCDPLNARQLPQWLSRQAQKTHRKKLAVDAARLLVELAGEEVGPLAGELEKLALYVGDRSEITHQDIDTLVGRHKLESVWEFINGVVDGRADRALTVLDRLLMTGEQPVGLLALLAWRWRQMLQIAQQVAAGTPVLAAVRQHRMPPSAAQRLAQRINKLGLRRIARAYHLVLQADLACKGRSQLKQRIVLERLAVDLATSR